MLRNTNEMAQKQEPALQNLKTCYESQDNSNVVKILSIAVTAE